MIRVQRLTNETMKHWAAWHILNAARPEDIEEWEAASGLSFTKAVPIAFSRDPIWAGWTLGVEPFALAVWGVEPWVGDSGEAWMICTEHSWRYGKTLCKDFGVHFAEVCKGYTEVTAHSYAKNTLHHRWMRRMGMVETGTTTINGHPFIIFSTKDNASQCAFPSQQQ